MSAADVAGPTTTLAETIEAAVERREEIGPATKGAVREAVEAALDLLDRGAARVAEKSADGAWRVNQWLKKAVLLSFRLNDMSAIPAGPAMRPGGTRSPRSSMGGAKTASAAPVSAPCPARWCAARPMSRRAWC